MIELCLINFVLIIRIGTLSSSPCVFLIFRHTKETNYRSSFGNDLTIKMYTIAVTEWLFMCNRAGSLLLTPHPPLVSFQLYVWLVLKSRFNYCPSLDLDNPMSRVDMFCSSFRTNPFLVIFLLFLIKSTRAMSQFYPSSEAVYSWSLRNVPPLCLWLLGSE